MFKIGDFSKLSQVSVKTLRYYDDIGLLTPARVDRFTDYRYYTADQLPRLNRILALKDLGLSLEQIGQLLNGGLTPGEMRGMLKLKQAELREQVADEQARLARVETRLRQIELEGMMMTQEVALRRVEAQTVVTLRDTMPTYSDVARLFGEVFGALGAAGLRPVGPPMVMYHDQEYRDHDVDMEVAVPVSGPGLKLGLLTGGRVQVHELPAVATMACLVHQGPYNTIGEAYAALMRWQEANGYRAVGLCREVYLQGPGQAVDPSGYITEIQLPVEKG